jgi:hypothetical protein
VDLTVGWNTGWVVLEHQSNIGRVPASSFVEVEYYRKAAGKVVRNASS